MRQMENPISMAIIILILGFFSIVSFAEDIAMSIEDGLLDSDLDLDRRPHDLDLGKRVYGYYKRLPVYNFGLGKRTHLYNFGLGKRSEIDDSIDDFEEFEEYPYNEELESIPDLELYHDDNMQSMDKRNKLYSFGLGKRLHRYDFGLGKREIHRYDFGLGKRSPGALNRNKLYNFGLGKRTRLYSFGLGKRPYNQGPVPSRFNFGLGKRSETEEFPRNVITKRDVNEQNTQEAAHENTDKAFKELTRPKVTSVEKYNSTAELESHEVMGRSEKSKLSKRSSHRFTFENGKRPVFQTASGFSRQFRKPLYNFGLGKRTSSNDQTAQNFKSFIN